MTLGAFLFLLFLIIVSDTIAAFIGGSALWSHHRYNGHSEMARRIALVLFGVWFAGMAHLVANTFGYTTKPSYTLGFGISFWVGQAVKSACVWYFVLHIICNRPKQ
jgi:hypothetical protein